MLGMKSAMKQCMRQLRNKILVVNWTCLLAVLVLCPSFLMAAQSESRIKVTVAPIDNLQVTDATQGILLRVGSTPGSNALIGDSDPTARLSYAHNSAANKKITAQVSPADIPAGLQDITLTVVVMGGAEQNIVEGGVTQGAKNVLTDIASGYRENVPVTYSASATALGTQPGDYAFRVTFTSLDDD
jgi:hypothetical protein